MKKVNLNDIPWRERRSPKGRYHRFLRDVALAFRSPKTGPKLPGQPPFEVELVRMPAGARNFPLHSHATEWEFYLIVSGTGTMRAGKRKTALKPGDCVFNPPGEAHQIINSGRGDLLYYVIANNAPADFYYYPDSRKWGLSLEHVGLFRIREVDYYDGEE
ncbi:MAG: cupin [Verrucomicrobia bacterium]|nr:MAG: cupin [Verrucomicrobiota bacterium]